MKQCIFFLLISLGVCSCSSTRDVKVSRNPLEIPKVETEIEPIKLKEVHFESKQCMLVVEPSKKVFCMTEENLVNDIENINTIRKAYNEVILKYKADKSYYEDVLNKK